MNPEIKIDPLRIDRIEDHVKHGGRPRIEISSDVQHLVDQAQDALLSTDAIYTRGTGLVHVVGDKSPGKWLRTPTGLPLIRGAAPEWLWERMSSAATWKKFSATKGAWTDALPPPWAPKVLAARGEWPFPPIDGCTNAPVLRADGTVHDRPGYDAASRMLFSPSETWPEIKSEPTLTDAQLALAELVEPFRDFRFVSDSDRYSAIAFVLSIMARPAIDGPVPAFRYGSNTPGAGKGLAADTGAIIATGFETSKMAHTTNEEEVRKRMLAIGTSSPATVMIDNIEGSFGSPTWANVLTAGMYTDRVLGVTEDRTVSIRSVFCLTGNNIQLVGDTGRRVIPIDLDPKCEHPQDRNDFVHSDLKGYVKTDRVRLAVAALTVLRAYFVAGCPSHGRAPYGSYEAWDRVIRGAIFWASGTDLLDGVVRMRAQGVDSDVERLKALTRAWHFAIQEHPVTLHELLGTHCVGCPDLRVALDAFAIKGEPLTATLLGKRLQLYRGRHVDGLRIEQHPTPSRSGANRWQVVPC